MSTCGGSRLSIQVGPMTINSSLVSLTCIGFCTGIDPLIPVLYVATLKYVCLKFNVCILSLAMPKYASTFHQDFIQIIFQQGGLCPPGPPLKTTYKLSILIWLVFLLFIYVYNQSLLLTHINFKCLLL